MKVTKFAPDPFIATAIFGTAAFDEPEAIDSDNPFGNDDEDAASLQAPFEIFFEQAALQNLGLTKSNEPASTSSLAKAAISRKFGIARTETREIEGTLWACAFDCNGVMVDQQEIGPAPLGKRGSDSWDHELAPSTSSPSSNDLHKRAKDPKVARIEKTVYPSGACVVAELDEDNVCLKTYRIEM
jgi:hypothetical protein